MNFNADDRLDIIKHKCENDGLFFARYFAKARWGIKWKMNWHHVLISDELDKVVRGETKNLILNVCPGSSKTELAVINFIARQLAINKMCRFLHISYSDDLALLNSQAARDLITSDEYQQLWPTPIADDAKAKKRWNVVSDDGRKQGGVYAVSLGGQITGFRAGHMAEGFNGCFPAGTLVWTERGKLPIEDIVRKAMPIRVWAYDYEGTMALKPLTGWHKNPPNEIVRVTLSDKSHVDCTPDHKFWTSNRGWVRADMLRKEDNLPAVCSLVEGLNDVRVDPESKGGWVYAPPIFSTGAIFPVKCSEFSLLLGENGSEIGFNSAFTYNRSATRYGFPSIAAPNLIYNADFNAESLSYISRWLPNGVVNLQGLSICKNGNRVNLGLAKGSVSLGIIDVVNSSAVSQVGEAVIVDVPIPMAHIKPLRPWAYEGQHYSSVNIDNLNLAISGQADSLVSISISVGVENSLRESVNLTSGRSDSPFFASHKTSITHRVKPLILRDRSPISVINIGHAENTFCLTVKDYHNFTVEQGVIVKNCIVIDDPLKPEDARSRSLCRKANEKLVSTVKSRRALPTTPIILIMQRVGEEDPSGFIQDGGLGLEWKVVTIPALIDDEYVAGLDPKYRAMIEESERDEHGRFSFWPFKEPLPALLESERKSPSVFTSQYMQAPSPIGGDLIRGEWFQRYKMLPQMQHRVIYADTAQKTAERNDYSVFQCWGKGDKGVYLIDQIRGKWPAPELKRRAIDFWNKHRAADADEMGTLRSLKVEDKSSGTGLVQDIRADGRIPVFAIQRNRDKYTRVLDAQPYIESGRVFIPEEADFVSEFITECEAFTADDTHKHDDQIDPLCDAIDDMLGVKGDQGMWDNL